MIANKDKKISQMLKNWAEIVRSNPNLDVNSDMIYHWLITYDVQDEDKKLNLSDQTSKKQPNLLINPRAISPICNPQSTFNNWIQTYSNSKNTACFVDPGWPYFCQFISKDLKARRVNEHIKVYIPLDGEHIEYGAKMIFDFLDQNGISHLSQIGKKIRFDDIVIRLINEEDADRLLEFVNMNPYIQEGLIKPNAFAFQKDNIAMAVDGELSYNSTVAKLIEAYLKQCKQSNSLKYVDADDFYNYVTILYKRQFRTHEDDTLKRIFNWEDYEENNYREVISLILNSKSSRFNYQNFKEHYETRANINIKEDKVVKETNNMLIDAIKAMTQRFNADGVSNVGAYFYSGDPTFITSRNDLRYRIQEFDFRKKLGKILKEKDMTYEEYARDILKKNNIDLNDYIVDNSFKR